MTTEFVMVPREPTQEMLIAANSAWFIPDPSPFNKGDEARRAIYKAMIAAAPPAASVRAREIDAFEAGYIQGHDATVEGRYADPSDAAQDYVRTLLAPTVDERAASSEAAVAEPVAWQYRYGLRHTDPVFWSGWQQLAADSAQRIAEAHRVNGVPFESRPLYTHPAPTTADAGVTEAMVETFEAKFLECARTRPDSTLRDDMRAALVAALGARKGE